MQCRANAYGGKAHAKARHAHRLVIFLVFLVSVSAYHRSVPTLLAKQNRGFGGPPTGGNNAGNKGFGERIQKLPDIKASAPAPLPPGSAQQTKGEASAVIARTNEGVHSRLKALCKQDPALHEALELRRWLLGWEEKKSRLSLLEMAGLPEGALREADAKAAKLKMLMDTQPHLTFEKLHNTLQVLTWDSAAAARAERHDAKWGTLSTGAESFMQGLAKAAGEGRQRVLDVGCGDGLLLRWLEDKHGRPTEREKGGGVRGVRSRYVGVDISPEMIRQARERHPGASFFAQDFMTLGLTQLAEDETVQAELGDGFDVVVLNEVYHYLLDPRAALAHACSLLAPPQVQESDSGFRPRLVLSHPKGAASVRKQRAMGGPALIPSLMPTLSELGDMIRDMGLPLRVVEDDSQMATASLDQQYLVMAERVL